MKRALMFALATTLLVACGGGDDEEEATDAGQVTGIDAGTPDNCSVAASFGAVGSLEGEGETDSMTAPAAEYLEAVLAQDATTVDLLEVELYQVEGGLFENGITPGTIQLTGDETSYATCSACVLIYGNLSETAEPDFYLATAGTLELSSVAGTMTGTLTNATFQQVTIDWETFESTPVEGGCTSSISSVSFTGPLTVMETEE